MNINMTLIGQMIAMIVFVWFCMKFIWPPIITALDERRAKIAEGLAATDEAAKALEVANVEAATITDEARGRASEIIEQGNQRGIQILSQAKDEAVAERERQVSAADAEIQQSANHAREELRSSVATLAVLGAERLINKEIDPKTHEQLLEKLIAEI
ncbi:MAG: F0F1 ATP synthase subunit B [Proteobacteria bacterium]|nr:F0F1 ATP synthase subunit B [Pseudomonadota bacterium]